MTVHVLGGFSSGARRRILILVATAATLLLVALGALLFLISRPEAAPTVAYYIDKDGDMVADLRWNSRYVTIPFFRLKASNFSGTVYIWRNGQWVAEPAFLKKARWSREHGYRVVAKVPDAKWKASLSWALKHDVGTRSRFITWQAETNTIYSPELLPLADAKVGLIAPTPLPE